MSVGMRCDLIGQALLSYGQEGVCEAALREIDNCPGKGRTTYELDGAMILVLACEEKARWLWISLM
jgi:hypothetical protein